MTSHDLLTAFCLIEPWLSLGTFPARAHCCLTCDVHQESQILLCQATFQSANPQPVLMHAVIPSQVQDLVELCEVSSLLWSVEVPLIGSTDLWCTSHSSQFLLFQPSLPLLADSVFCTILCTILQVINEHVKPYWPQFLSLGSATSAWLDFEPFEPGSSASFHSTSPATYLVHTLSDSFSMKILRETVQKALSNSIETTSSALPSLMVSLLITEGYEVGEV